MFDVEMLYLMNANDECSTVIKNEMIVRYSRWLQPFLYTTSLPTYPIWIASLVSLVCSTERSFLPPPLSASSSPPSGVFPSPFSSSFTAPFADDGTTWLTVRNDSFYFILFIIDENFSNERKWKKIAKCNNWL